MAESHSNKNPWPSLAPSLSLALILIVLEAFQLSGWSSLVGHSGLFWLAAGSMLTAVLLVASVIRILNRVAGSSTQRQDEARQFRALIDGVADHALYTLDAQGIVTSWNAGAQRLKGYASSEIIGEHYSRFFTEEDQKAGVPQKALETAARKAKFEAEGWRLRRDGTRFYASAILTAWRDSSGKVIGFSKITRDITERVQQTEALEQTRAALFQSQKMESLGQLTGGMAHDFNNILHVIKNALEIARTRLQKVDPDSLRYLDMARRSAERATGVTQRLLAFARRQPLDPKPLNANRLLQSMSDMLRHAIGDGVSIETVLSSGLWTVCVDENQLEAAVLNLTINARDAMRREGKLTVETANALLDEAYAIAHPEVTAGQYVMIAVSDTGVGMSKEVLAKAFDPFFTTKEAEQGTGLGLSQVFGFVKQSGGHVKIYSEPGEGTTVKIYLPRLSAPGLGPLPPESVSSEEGGSGETILVVEDHDDVRAFAVDMLTSLGYRVSSAPDAASALQLVNQLPQLDLLFTDVGLPNGVNGRQLADEVKKLRPATAVLFTTGYARNAIVHHGRLDPGVELLLKPYTQLDLARKLRSMLNGVSQAGKPT